MAKESGAASCHQFTYEMANNSGKNVSRDFWRFTRIPVVPWLSGTLFVFHFRYPIQPSLLEMPVASFLLFMFGSFWGQIYHQGTVDISERKIWIWNGKPGSGGSYLPAIIFVEWHWGLYSGKGCSAVLAASPPIWGQVGAPFTGDWRNCAAWVVWWQRESENNLSRSWKNGGHLFELSAI